MIVAKIILRRDCDSDNTMTAELFQKIYMKSNKNTTHQIDTQQMEA